MSNTLTESVTRPHAVILPGCTVHRPVTDDNAEAYDDHIPGSTVIVPTATSKAQAIDKALAMHREKWGIPSSVTLRPTAQVTGAPIGLTMGSKSGTARWRGKTVS